MSTSTNDDTTTVITAINRSYHKVTATADQLDSIDHFTANDGGMRVGGHRARPTASPEFELLLTSKSGEDSVHNAHIVAVADSPSGSIGPNQPVAIAAVTIDGQEWYVMITRKTRWDGYLHIEDYLVAIEGYPEGLLHQVDAFMQS